MIMDKDNMLDGEIKKFIERNDNVKTWRAMHHDENQRIHVFFITESDTFDWDLNDACGTFDSNMWNWHGLNTHSIALSQANIETTGAIDGLMSGGL